MQNTISLWPLALFSKCCSLWYILLCLCYFFCLESHPHFFCLFLLFQTWMEHDLGPNQHLFLEAPLALSPRPCELGDCIQCSSLVLRNNLWIAVTLLLGALADCRLPEDRDFVLLISLLDEFARGLGTLGALHRSLVNTWQFTLGLHYAPHRIVWRIY